LADVRMFVDGLLGAGAFAQLPVDVDDLIMNELDALQQEMGSDQCFTTFTCDDAAEVTTPTLLLSGGSSVRMLQLVVDELERCLPDNEHVRLSPTSQPSARTTSTDSSSASSTITATDPRHRRPAARR
jgi:hypothetical protein